MTFLNIIKKSNNFFLNSGKKIIENPKKIINLLNEEKLIMICGSRGVGKTKTINSIIQKTNYKESFLYINKELDLLNEIKEKNDLEKLINIFIKENKLKLIILENVYFIKNIKSFISSIYQKGYKIILIGNSIKVGKKPEIEIYKDKQTIFSYLNKNDELSTINIEKDKAQSTILNEIYKPFSIKNFNLYNYSLSFLANYNHIDSVRNIWKQINNIIKISLVSLSEYIRYTKQAKILNQVFVYDFKKEKIIESKSKFYFFDIDFRNSLYNFELHEKILKENFLFLELQKRGFEIFSGKNGSYDFNFYARKKVTDGILKESIFIDFCTTQNKQEFKKQLNKLLKVPNPKNSLSKKYLIINSKKELSITKMQYDNLEIISFDELLKKI